MLADLWENREVTDGLGLWRRHSPGTPLKAIASSLKPKFLIFTFRLPKMDLNLKKM